MRGKDSIIIHKVITNLFIIFIFIMIIFLLVKGNSFVEGGIYKASNGANTYIAIDKEDKVIMINGSSPMGTLNVLDTYTYDKSTKTYQLSNNSIKFTTANTAFSYKINITSTRRSDININGEYKNIQ